MYLHAGNNRILRSGSIIGVFDMDSATVGTDTKNFLRRSEKNGLAESAAEELPKSFVLYNKPNGSKSEYRIMFSQISTSALISRMKISSI